MKLRFSDEAKADLLHIGDYIAAKSSRLALDFVKNLRAKSAELAEMPLAFPFASDFAHLGIRRRVVGNYLIFYRIEADIVTIIHILHGAQDYGSWLDQS